MKNNNKSINSLRSFKIKEYRKSLGEYLGESLSNNASNDGSKIIESDVTGIVVINQYDNIDQNTIGRIRCENCEDNKRFILFKGYKNFKRDDRVIFDIREFIREDDGTTSKEAVNIRKV